MATKITYATMSPDNEEMNSRFEAAAEAVKDRLGLQHGLLIGDKEILDRETYEEVSPIDSGLVIGRYAQATSADVDTAVAAAKSFAPEWDGWGWERRRDLMLAAADIMEGELYELGALMSYEVGKNRLESLGDIAETIEFLRYYSKQITDHEGFVTRLGSHGASDLNTSVLRPFGAWAVISPFNFPMALAGGPSIGALLTGNTVVIKPSNAGALMALEFHRIMGAAGLPADALHVLTGGDEVGDALAHHDSIDGLTFTGSYPVGMYLYRTANEKRPKPVVCEMGGKNPAIVTDSADLEVAAQGIVRGAFGLSGQKCSATSRVYAEEAIYDDLVAKLVEQTKTLSVGDPLDKDTFMGPVIDRDAVERFEKAVDEVEGVGGEVYLGGHVLTADGLGKGNFVEPTIVTAPYDSWVWSEELFLPFVAVGRIGSLEEGIERSNDTDLGLTAGLFTGDEAEVDQWFSRIEAGVVYVNRSAGATTGAWPDIQSFGGWKGSGTSGAGGGGPWYLKQFLREQSRTLIKS
jgi:1-pyrroline-5-carboxylate dehydrogenase